MSEDKRDFLTPATRIAAAPRLDDIRNRASCSRGKVSASTGLVHELEYTFDSLVELGSG